eukprot:GEMP01080581.1.p2 GENE.GEMP01080581.1~~GEMP01080581.1.p2  ORF type:complete len:126 (+),score=31.66 GEMP01080581.1:57-380(+)
MSAVVVIENTAQFKEILKKDKLVVMFTASWCGPCQNIKPKFLAMPSEYSGLSFAMVDGDDVDDLAEAHEIEGFPTFLFFANGVRKDELTLVGVDEQKLISHAKKLQE